MEKPMFEPDDLSRYTTKFTEEDQEAVRRETKRAMEILRICEFCEKYNLEHMVIKDHKGFSVVAVALKRTPEKDFQYDAWPFRRLSTLRAAYRKSQEGV